MFMENFVENVVSEIYKKNNFCLQNPPKIVNAFMDFVLFLFAVFFLEGDSMSEVREKMSASNSGFFFMKYER